MGKKIDARILKTYRELTDALISLLQTVEYDNITVNDLCRAAQVRRATFYKHFKDKTDFAAYTVSSIHETCHAFANSEETAAAYLTAYAARLFDICEKGFPFCAHIVSSRDLAQLMQAFEGQICLGVRERLSHESGLPASADMVSIFFSAGVTQIIYSWMTAAVKIPKERLLSSIDGVLKSLTKHTEEKQ